MFKILLVSKKEYQPTEEVFDPLNPPLPRVEVGNALLTEDEYNGLLQNESLVDVHSNGHMPASGFAFKTTHRSFIEKPGSGKLTRRPHKHSRGEEWVAQKRRNMRDSAFYSSPGRLLRESALIEDDSADSATILPQNGNRYLHVLPAIRAVSESTRTGMRDALADRLIKNYLATLPS